MDSTLLPALHDALTVARHGSVARAAEALFKTPSAVSQQLRRIESHFGVALFERDGRGLRLTAAGEAFLGPATRLFDEAESVYGLLGALSGSAVTTVRLAVSDYLGKELLAPVLRDVSGDSSSEASTKTSRSAPHGAASSAAPPVRPGLAPLRFSIVTAHSSDAARLLELGQVDAAIVSTASAHPRLDEHLLFEQKLKWIAARRTPLRPLRDRLATEPVLRLSPGSLGRTVLDAWLERSGIAPASTIDVPSVSLLVAYAATGCGIGLAPALPLLDVDPAAVVLEDADLPPLAVRLALRPNFPPSPAMADFLDKVRRRGSEIAARLGAEARHATATSPGEETGPGTEAGSTPATSASIRRARKANAPGGHPALGRTRGPR